MEYMVLGGVAVIMLAAIIAGYLKGFVRIILSLAAALAAFLVAMILANPIGNLVKNSDMYEDMKTSVAESLCSGLMDEGLEITSVTELREAIQLPDVIAEQLAESIRDSFDEELQGPGQISITDIAEITVGKITDFLVDVAVFILLFILSYIAFRIIIMVVDFTAKLPGVNLINRLLGAVLGAVHGMLIIWVASLVLTAFAGTSTGGELLQTVSENELLNWIYSHNLLWNFVISVIG